MSSNSVRLIRRAALSIAALAAFACAATGVASAQERLTGRFFVKLRSAAQATVSATGIRFADALDAKASRWAVVKLDRIGAPRSGFSKGTDELARFVLVTLSDPATRDAAMADFASDPAVEYVEPEHVLRVDVVPNDSAYTSQWGMKRIGMEKAWDRTRGSADVLLGVIDTGIDYFHPDLRTQTWINAAEDGNRNGGFEPWASSELRNGVAGDFDGIDNDGNGFVDDVIGYDFVDQPGEGNAAGGDYRDPDADPLDEMGHGSSVSGIIGAATDNTRGVAGIAHGCRMMTLRAFDARGVGAEGDVARCIAYAIDNGAVIINMSFGDTQYSRVLRDMVRYAFGRGVTMVASAGNSGNAVLHYPSAYDETISVSASAANDNLAGFSNYGATVDIAAPGQDVVTTERDGRYGSFNGTSASAPFVTGVAALVKSLHPAFGPEEIRGVLIASAADLGAQGWDDRFGAGLLDASRAVLMEQPTVVKIIEPKTDQMFTGGTITVTGTAASPLMTGFTLEVGTGVNPSRWTILQPFRKGQAIAETLAVVDIASWRDTTYTLRLSAKSDKGVSLEDRTVIAVKRTPPKFLGVGFIPSVDSRFFGVAVGFITDEPTLGKAYYRAKGGADWTAVSLEGTTENNLFVGTTHYRFIGGGALQPGLTYEFYLSATNAAGVESIAKDGINYFELTVAPPIPESGLRKKPYALPLGRLFPGTPDFNANGKPELLFNSYSDDSRFSVMEFNGTSFASIGGSAQRDQFPRGFGALGGSGSRHLLTSFVRQGFLYEAPSAGSIPSTLIWADSVNQFWPITIADVNNDGTEEVLAVVNDSTVGVFTLSPAKQLTRIGSIVNPTRSRLGTKRVQQSARRHRRLQPQRPDRPALRRFERGLLHR
ncbi:MAG: S8 family serine peptidase [Ignavibacteria bacterium]|nr:S8 family serine peptidase [Ignavibacteria bacterium]